MLLPNHIISKLKVRYTNAICENRYEDDKIFIYVSNALSELSEYYTDLLNMLDVNWKDKMPWDGKPKG